jgi:hypothetical protein
VRPSQITLAVPNLNIIKNKIKEWLENIYNIYIYEL